MCWMWRPGIRHTNNLPRLPDMVALRHHLRPLTRLAHASPRTPSPRTASPLSRESPNMPTIAVLPAILGTNGDIRFSDRAFPWFGTQPGGEKQPLQALPAQRYCPNPARHPVPRPAEPVLAELF